MYPRKKMIEPVLIVWALALAALLLVPACSDQSQTSDTESGDGKQASSTPAAPAAPAAGRPGPDEPADGQAAKPAPDDDDGERPDAKAPDTTNNQPRPDQDGTANDGGPDERRDRPDKPAESKPNGKPEGREPKDKDNDKPKEDTGDPNDPLEPVSFKDFEVAKLMDKVGQWTGKVIIPVDGEVLKQKVTIYSTKKLPRSKALLLFYQVLRTKGFIVEEQEEVIYLRPLKDAKLFSVPTIPADQPLALIADKQLIVQKFFRLRDLSPEKIKGLIQPLIPEYGYVSADEASRSLVVIDTVESLQRIERIIQQLDRPEEEQTVTRIFEIKLGDPGEITQMLNIILGEDGNTAGRRSNSSYRTSSNRGGTRSGATGMPKPAPLLIPEPTRRWIVAKAAPEDMDTIAEWIDRLDRKQEVETDYTIIPVEHANAEEIADQINRMMNRIPGSEVMPNMQIFELEQNNTLLVIGSKERRELVAKMVQELDIPPGTFETVHIKLKYAEPEQIKQYVEELYSKMSSSGSGSLYSYTYVYDYYGRSRGNQRDIDEVRVIAYPMLKQVTVIAGPHKIEDIKKQIEEWDQPLDVDSLNPMIVELKNSDSLKMTELLNQLFSEERQSGYDIIDLIYGRSRSNRPQNQVVGPLYGKLSFAAVPDTKKIIVISQIPEAYDVVRALIEELDRQEAAELPRVVVLKYADPEDLCERLNALLNEPGTEATIHLAKRQLTSYSSGASDTSDSSRQGNQPSGNNNQRQQEQSDVYKPWWTSGQRRQTEEEPISNIIGQIRFIPDHRSKAILVLCPSEYLDAVEKMIEVLDQPASQVMIKAVILQVQHEDMTTLGVQLSSNPGAFGVLGENALSAAGQLNVFQGLYEGSSFSTLTGSTQRGTVTLSSDFNVTALVDFLVKKTNAKILNEPKVWAKDNEEATFFNGGTVPFITESKSSAESTSFTQSYTEKQVGLTLRVRPNITPEKAVDMEINLIVSQREPDLVLGNIATQETNTTTHMIINDGETILLSGILFQNDTKIERKLPLFGDIPLLGELFKHHDTVQANNELLLFITPHVIEQAGIGQAAEEIRRAREKLDKVKAQFDTWLEETHPENNG